jgi:RNA polymerase sigma factor (sigma-70 family)
MTDSQQLLSEYVRSGSDAAFRELVTRYIDLVYSAALRLVGNDAHRAKDVSQTVFADLARTARTLSPEIMLGGWLHRHACFVASNVMRGERRRQSRERQAVEMSALDNNPEVGFSRIAPMLDQAINELGEADRTAIVLRFFEHRDFRSVGAAIGSNEDAARMRVNRAVEKLQSLLERRGVKTAAGALAVALSTHVVQAAPVGLAAAVSSAAVLAGTSFSTVTATSATTQAIAMTTLQKTLVATALLAAIGAGIYEHRQAASLRTRIEALQEQRLDQLDRLRDENARLASELAAKETSRVEGLRELIRLRNEVGQLRAQFRERPTRSAGKDPASSQADVPPEAVEPRVLSASVSARVPNGQTLVTGGWASADGKRTFVFMTPLPDTTSGEDHQVVVKSLFVEVTEETLAGTGLNGLTSDTDNSSLAGLYTASEFHTLLAALELSGGAEILSAPGISTLDGRQGQLSVMEKDGSGTVLDILPKIAPEGDAIDLLLGVQVPPKGRLERIVRPRQSAP